MSRELRYEEIEALTLITVPEIRDAYSCFGGEEIPYPTDEWLKELSSIPVEDERRLGATIVFENLLVPFIISLFEDEQKNAKRIKEIMDWIECLAHQDDIRICGTLIDVCFWQGILSKFSDDLPRIFPYFNTRTKEICLESSKHLRLNPHIRQYLDEQELIG